MAHIVEVEFLKVVCKKMYPLINVEDDYAILDELLKVGEVTQTLSVSPITLAMEKTDKDVHLEMSQDNYILNEQTEELYLGQILRSRKYRVVATSSSGVTVTKKRVADNVALERARGKRPIETGERRRSKRWGREV